MDKLAEFLIEKETITGKEFMKIYRKAKGLPEPTEDEDTTKTPSRIKEKAKKASKAGADSTSDEEDLDEYLKELEAEMEEEKKAAEKAAAEKEAELKAAAEAKAETEETETDMPSDDQDLQTQIKKSFQAVVDDRISVTKTETIEYEAREDTKTGAYSAPEKEDTDEIEDAEEDTSKAEDNDSDEGTGSGGSSLPSGGVFSGQS